MNFAIFYNPNKKETDAVVKTISDFLFEHQMQVFLEDDHLNIKQAKLLSTIDPKSIHFSICLGGDGSILRAVHKHKEIQAPIIGINMGGLGFLADTPLDELLTTLDQFLKNQYSIQKRMMMEGTTFNNESSFSVNEIVVHRAQNPSLVDLAIYVDNKYLNTFSADGVIFSTATGSTAYSLAAGGPILTPELDAFVITPICPHTITNRPIVLMPKQEIKVIYTSHHLPIEITFDGYTSFAMKTGEYLTIKRSPRQFQVVCMNHHDYFSTLRTKLHWAGKLKT